MNDEEEQRGWQGKEGKRIEEGKKDWEKKWGKEKQHECGFERKGKGYEGVE